MSLFSLDILEPSLIKRSQSPHIPLQTLSSTSTEASAIPSDQLPKSDESSPPRWNTPEFWFYGFVFVTVVPMMFWSGYDVSRGTVARIISLMNQATIPTTRNTRVCCPTDGSLVGKLYVILGYMIDE
jgi:hypothetical protein